MPPFLKFGEIGALGNLGKLNSDSFEPLNFWRDWTPFLCRREMVLQLKSRIFASWSELSDPW